MGKDVVQLADDRIGSVPRWCWRSVDVGANGGVWPWRAVIAMMIGGPETTGHKLRKPNQCLSMAVPMSVSQLEVIVRTFAVQVEALKRYRSGGEQTVRVEHVTVNDPLPSSG
jgi:hypothetical protein